MLFLQLACLLLVLLLIRSFIPLRNTILSLFLSLVFGIVFAIQFSSTILTGNIADYRFYENFSLKDATSVSDFFGAELLYIIIALIGSALIIHFLGKGAQKWFTKKIIPMSLLLFGIVVMSLNGGIINNAVDTLQLKFAGSASFKEALSAINIDPDAYVEKNEIQAASGKNIIVLSLESFEKGYLNEKLSHLTPNLSRLAKNGTFYSMEQSPAGGWTSASLYTLMSGVPAFFGLHGNNVFQNNYENKLTSLADVLKSANYDVQYFIGKKEFSGIDDMLKSFGVTVKSEKDFAQRYEEVGWGIHDKDLFEEFKKELLLKKESDTPFALFLSTISTHFPNGVLDERMESALPPQNSDLEFMVSATDHYVGDLITFLEKENMLSNTVFYIFPDHLLMGNTAEILEEMDERSLFMMTNADSEKFSYPTNKPINQVDLPKMILQGADVEHNVPFLTDYMEGPDKNAFLLINMQGFARLNDAALKRIDCKEGIFIEIEDEYGAYKIKNEDGLTIFSGKLPLGKVVQRIVFDADMRAFDDMEIDFDRADKNTPKTPFLDIFNANEITYASLKGPLDFAITKKGDSEITFKKKEITLLNEVYLTKEADNIFLKSSGYFDKAISFFSIKDEKITLSRGLTVIVLNKTSDYEYKSFDTYGSSEEAADFITALKTLQQNNVRYIILAHDSAAKGLAEHKETLMSLGLKTLADLQPRQAYLMHNLNGEIVENLNAISIRRTLRFPDNISNSLLFFSRPIESYTEEIERFIAHAGGELDGIKYTNTKEALDINYAKGFRYFELDIIETSDGTFVASHDWGHWSKQTNFKGETPVTRTEFLKQKIYGKYTPLDIKGINEWFAAHPDATLITDKTNKPLTFAKQFVDKERLMMELFTHDSLETAIQNGIKGIISTVPLSQVPGNKITYLKEHNVEYAAIPRANIPAQKDMLKQLRKNGVKVFVYQVNVEPGKDEKYVLENEIGIVYGMYADKWIFDLK